MVQYGLSLVILRQNHRQKEVCFYVEKRRKYLQAQRWPLTGAITTKLDDCQEFFKIHMVQKCSTINKEKGIASFRHQVTMRTIRTMI